MPFLPTASCLLTDTRVVIVVESWSCDSVQQRRSPAVVRLVHDWAHTVLYCTVLYCTVLYCTVLYCTVQQRRSPAVVRLVHDWAHTAS